MTVRILQGDALEQLRTLADESVHSVVTDPPYGLEFMGKAWDGADGFRRSLNAADADRESVFGRTSRTSPEYRTGNSFQQFCEAWARECLRVLKPGGHLLSFGGSRTYHRMACAIEDAGFEIRDQIMWVYGSGFPKSLDVSKAIDKAAGAEREVIGFGDVGRASNVQPFSQGELGATDTRAITAPATEAARQWQGWGTALKPAHEPIVVARKPLIGTVAANVLKHGTGAINVDACRIEGAPPSVPQPALRPNGNDSGHALGTGNGRNGEMSAAIGRWPANLIHDGSDEVVALFPADAGAAAPVTKRNGDKFRNSYGAFAGDIDEQGSTFHGDSGSAARFFYTAKASRDDRNIGCDDLEARPLNWSSGTQSPGTFQSPNTDRSARNHHPTVKPTDLMQYLVRLVTPRGGTVLDPFAGSGSTGLAADREGFDAILIEREAEYVEIAKRRIRGDCPLFDALEIAA